MDLFISRYKAFLPHQRGCFKLQSLLSSHLRLSMEYKANRRITTWDGLANKMYPSKTIHHGRHVHLAATPIRCLLCKFGVSLSNFFDPYPGGPTTSLGFLLEKGRLEEVIFAKLRVFLCSIFKKAILLGEDLLRRGILRNSTCPRCGDVKTETHIFFSCPFSQGAGI